MEKSSLARLAPTHRNTNAGKLLPRRLFASQNYHLATVASGEKLCASPTPEYIRDLQIGVRVQDQCMFVRLLKLQSVLRAALSTGGRGVRTLET